MVKPTFAQKVEALEKFFGSSSSAPLQERINGWNAQMGLGETPIGSNGLPIPMPDQIDCLIADTGIVVEAVLHKDAPRPPSDLKLVEYVEKAKNRPDAPLLTTERQRKLEEQNAATGTSLGGIGGISTGDPKLKKALERHAHRNPQKLDDPRQKKIAALRHLMEGGPDVPDKYKHADYLPADAEGTLPTQIAGGKSYSLSMINEWESPSFFKDTATKLATKPIMRRCNPVGGMYPEFR